MLLTNTPYVNFGTPFENLFIYSISGVFIKGETNTVFLIKRCLCREELHIYNTLRDSNLLYIRGLSQEWGLNFFFFCFFCTLVNVKWDLRNNSNVSILYKRPTDYIKNFKCITKKIPFIL